MQSPGLACDLGFELNTVSRTTKPRCKVHSEFGVRGEPCLCQIPRPPAGIYQYVLLHKVWRRPGIKPRKSQFHKGWILINIPVSKATN
jgi:hypothetical protein